MLSLEKTYEVSDLFKWIGGREVVSAYKIDGISCSLIYKKGVFKLAKTRGDGSWGEDISEKIKWVQDVPQKLKKSIDVEIRGEVFCDEKNFIFLCKEMERRGLEVPASPRNIVAGLMGRKEGLDLCRFLRFGSFDFIPSDMTLNNEWEKIQTLFENDFWLPSPQLHKSTDSLQDVIKEAQSFMSEGEYQIDGLVFTFNDIHHQNELGATAHHPRYRIAFKFSGETKETEIQEIEWSVSRNGILTPVALISPVTLSGAEISRVTLHNLGMVKQFKLKKGDKILIVRSGEVIPKFLEVRASSTSPLKIPTKCPSCSAPLKEVEIRLVCDNEDCSGKIEEGIVDFVQKIGIEDLSTKRIQELIRVGLVHDPSDLFKLREEDFYLLDKVKEKLAKKLHENIQRAKEVELPIFLFSLGISGLGLSKCEKIVDAGRDSIDKVLHLKDEDLMKIEGFAEKSSQEIIKSIHLKRALITKMLGAGMTIKQVKKLGHILAGKTICITGPLSEKRSVIEKVIKDNSGRCVSSVSKETSFLLTNETDSTSSKFLKAKELGTRIISEEDFFKMVNDEKE